jgi:hypothetical protein
MRRVVDIDTSVLDRSLVLASFFSAQDAYRHLPSMYEYGTQM